MCGAGEPASLVDTEGRVGRRTIGDLLSRAEETWAGTNPGARNGRMDSARPPGPLHRGEGPGLNSLLVGFGPGARVTGGTAFRMPTGWVFVPRHMLGERHEHDVLLLGLRDTSVQ
jgi:hypothetical protein